VVGFPVAYQDRRVAQFISQAQFAQPGSYKLRLLDPHSGVTSGPFCGSDQGLTASGCQPPGPRTASSLAKTTTSSRYVSGLTVKTAAARPMSRRHLPPCEISLEPRMGAS
jgi:hypothetical protein